jgi:hypothetical protein
MSLSLQLERCFCSASTVVFVFQNLLLAFEFTEGVRSMDLFSLLGLRTKLVSSDNKIKPHSNKEIDALLVGGLGKALHLNTEPSPDQNQKREISRRILGR